MEEIQLSERITVGPQPSPEMIEDLSRRGFRAVVNLSRKGELDQVLKPEEEEIEVTSFGMRYVHIPLSILSLKPIQADEFINELEHAGFPAYVHCRIGQRAGPFALIYHGLRTGLAPHKLLEKARRLGLTWRAPYLSDFMTRYIETRRAEHAVAA